MISNIFSCWKQYFSKTLHNFFAFLITWVSNYAKKSKRDYLRSFSLLISRWINIQISLLDSFLQFQMLVPNQSHLESLHDQIHKIFRKCHTKKSLGLDEILINLLQNCPICEIVENWKSHILLQQSHIPWRLMNRPNTIRSKSLPCWVRQWKIISLV